MKSFILELKKIYTNKLVIVMIGFLIVVAITDPLFIYYVNGSQGDFFQNIGKHPFQFWLLMNSSSWGHAIYYILFFLFPIISTGFVYYHEQSTSIMELTIVKGKRKQYFGVKTCAVFCSTLLNFLIILGINLLVTYMCFDVNAPRSGQYAYNVPKVGSFAYDIYQISPLLMAVFYTIFNAFMQAVFAVWMIGIQMLFRFKKIYTAIIVPYMLIYATNYITEVLGMKVGNMKYCILYIVQPKTAAALITPVAGMELLLTIIFIVSCALLTIILGIKRNEDIL